MYIFVVNTGNDTLIFSIMYVSFFGVTKLYYNIMV